MKTRGIVLNLTDEEIHLLRNSTSDLGTNTPSAMSLQLKIANALLDAGWKNTHGRELLTKGNN